MTKHYGQGPTLIQDMSESETIPKKFLEQILLTLKGFGLVHSKKGKGGGYSLAQPPRLIMLGPVVRMMEGPLAPLPCASETRYKKCEECPDAENLRDANRDAVRSATPSRKCSTISVWKRPAAAPKKPSRKRPARYPTKSRPGVCVIG
ncbi:MAG: Rrf2 family transcriptional regulator [Acidobacteriota bacterium]